MTISIINTPLMTTIIIKETLLILGPGMLSNKNVRHIDFIRRKAYDYQVRLNIGHRQEKKRGCCGTPSQLSRVDQVWLDQRCALRSCCDRPRHLLGQPVSRWFSLLAVIFIIFAVVIIYGQRDLAQDHPHPITNGQVVSTP